MNSLSDSHYIIGLDIGSDSSAIAFYNAAAAEPELIDLSGGYGRPTIPTAMQFIPESREWVYGEYAILNAGQGAVIKNLMAHLTNSGNAKSAQLTGFSEVAYIDVDGRPTPVTTLLGLYIKELLANVWSINPKAEIVGIVAAIPANFSKYAKEAFRASFKRAGYEKELLALATSGECIFNYHYRGGFRHEQSLVIDYGADAVRGGVYVSAENSDSADKKVKNISSYFDEELGTAKITAKTAALFRDIYREELNGKEPPPDQLEAFVYQHKDLLFQKAIRERAAKLYFNFAYPPFARTVTARDVEALTADFRSGFNNFFRQVLEQNPFKKRITAMDIDSCLCTGGGFEMLWARESLLSLFPRQKLHFHKNSKSPVALGAAVLAARLLGANLPHIKIEDTHRLTADIGIAIGGRNELATLAELGSFWWQKHPAKTFLVNRAVEGPHESIPLQFVSRDEEGNLDTIAAVTLDGLPSRPKGTTKLSARLQFASETQALATIKDCGFGELFPAVEYVRECEIYL